MQINNTKYYYCTECKEQHFEGTKVYNYHLLFKSEQEPKISEEPLTDINIRGIHITNNDISLIKL